MQIVIPSHRRPQECTTLRYLPSGSLCVAEGEVDQYRRSNPNARFIVHPDDVVGITKKRQWILDNVGGDVFMADDDIVGVVDSRLGRDQQRVRIGPDKIEDRVWRLWEAAKGLGVYLFGYPVENRHGAVRNPFALTGFTAGHCMGIRDGGGLYYNTNIVSCDDGWISLLNAYKHRIALMDRSLVWIHRETFRQKGGLSDFRSKESYWNDLRILTSTFGEESVPPELNTGKRNWVVIRIPY